MVVHVVTARL